MANEIKLDRLAGADFKKKLQQIKDGLSETEGNLNGAEGSAKSLQYASISSNISQTRTKLADTSKKLREFEQAYDEYVQEIERFDRESAQLLQNMPDMQKWTQDTGWEADPAAVLQNLLEKTDNPTLIKRYLDALTAAIDTNFIIDTSLDALVTAISVYGAKALQMPKFEVAQGMVRIFNSEYYSGGSGGVRRISETSLLNRSDKLGQAFRFTKTVKAVNSGLVVLSGALSFIDEYNRGADLSQKERAVNAAVEGTWSISIAVGAMATGAAIGSILPIGGTVVGAVVGFAVGTVISVLADGAINAKQFDDRQKSAMDYIKQGANVVVDTAVKVGPRIANVYEVGVNAGKAIASWFEPSPAF